jgi:hypothetical protein
VEIEGGEEETHLLGCAWLVPPTVEERSTSPSAGKREGVEPPRTGFEEEEEQGAAGRRH